MFADVTSANIVGYQNAGFKDQGYNCSIATFETVSGETLTLGDIKPEGMEDSYLVFLTPGGAVAKVDFLGKKVQAMYYYVIDEDGDFDGDGWYLANDDEDLLHNQNNVEIPYGTGFFVYRSGFEKDAKLTSAGAVKLQPTTIDFKDQGYNTKGNCLPKAIKLGDLVPDGMEDSYITFLTPGGAVAKVDFLGKKVQAMYYYVIDEDGDFDGDGWYLANDDEDLLYNQNEKVTLEAGQGFMVYRSGFEKDATITIPGALD